MLDVDKSVGAWIFIYLNIIFYIIFKIDIHMGFIIIVIFCTKVGIQVNTCGIVSLRHLIKNYIDALFL